MMNDVPGRTLLLAACALLPALVTYWRGRALARALEDPALPERLASEQRRAGSIVGIVCGILIIASPGAIGWTLPLVIVAYVAAAYPLRRALYQETWTFAGYLSFMGRLAIAVWGFWLALGLLPYYAPKAGRYDWMVAAVMAVALLVWNARYADIFCRLLRTRPLTDLVLLDRYAVIVQRSGVAAPRFEYVPLAGGALSTAAALPAGRQSVVLFTDTFLAQMDADEATAVCAHEIAHLEHHTPRLLKRLNAVNIALIGGATLTAIGPRLMGLESSLLPLALWLPLLLGVMMWRARDRQRNETASDVRAIALCGDPEALIRALIKLHTFARLPRRMDANVERHATHPSLARRIRDIRAAAGSTPAALGTASTFEAVDGGASVTFETERLQWREGDAALHAFGYGRFSELRLDVSASGNPALIAVERGGRKWRIRIAPGDAARLQAVLDIVDGRLTDPAPAPAAFARLGRMTAAFAAAFAILLGQYAMAIIAAIALLQPSAAPLAAAGTATMAAALITVTTFGPPSFDAAGLVAMLGTIAALLLVAAYSRRSDTPSRTAAITIGVLSVLSAFSCAALVLNGWHPVDLHLSARQTPASAVFLLATAAAMFAHQRSLRYLAPALAALAAGVLLMGSTWFLEQFGRDPFIATSQPIAWTTVSGNARDELDLPFYPSSVQLSPGGRALLLEQGHEDDRMPEFHVLRPGGEPARVRADDVVFIDDDRLLALEQTAAGAILRAAKIDTPDTAIWRRELPDVWHLSLTIESTSGVWRVIGTAEDDSIVRVEGTEAASVRETRWPALGGGRTPDYVAIAGNTALVTETRARSSLLDRYGLWRVAVILRDRRMESRFSRLTTESRTEVAITRLTSECQTTSADGAQLICAAFDGTRTRFASVDAVTGDVAVLGMMPGRFVWYGASPNGWLSGWAGSQAVAIHPASRRGIRLAPESNAVSYLAVSGRTLAAVCYKDGASTIRTYPLEEDPQRGLRATRTEPRN